MYLKTERRLNPVSNLDIELQIAEVALQEAEESFAQLREDYHKLREHADILEELLKDHCIEFPEFCEW